MSFVLEALIKAERERQSSDCLDSSVEISEFLKTDTAHQQSQVNLKKVLLLFFLIISFAILFLVSNAGPQELETHDKTQFGIDSNSAKPSLLKDDVSPNVIDAPINVQATTAQTGVLTKKLTLNVTGYIYLGNNNSANKVFIDEKSYRVGSLLSDGFEIVSISNEQLTLNRNGEELVILY